MVATNEQTLAKEVDGLRKRIKYLETLTIPNPTKDLILSNINVNATNGILHINFDVQSFHENSLLEVRIHEENSDNFPGKIRYYLDLGLHEYDWEIGIGSWKSGTTSIIEFTINNPPKIIKTITFTVPCLILK